MKITIELTGTLELAALESALEMFEAWAEEVIASPEQWREQSRTPQRVQAEAHAGIALLKRVRGERG